VTLSAAAEADATRDWNGDLYRTEPPGTQSIGIKAVPYFAWDNREPGEHAGLLRGG